MFSGFRCKTLAVVASVAVMGWMPWTAVAQAQRPLAIDDMFRLESIGRYYGGPYGFAPDGQSLAFTRVRPSQQLKNFKHEYLWGNAGADVWLQRAAGQPAENLTHGEEDGAGWWAPQWSPDGQRLSMLSTKTGDNVTLWVWDRASGKLKQLTRRGVDLQVVQAAPIVWVDDRHILCAVLPEGKQPLGMEIELMTPRKASEAWPKTRAGVEPTASVLDSGVEADLNARPQSSLLLIDAVTGEQRTIVSRSTRGWMLAPDHAHVAFLVQKSIYRPKAEEALPFGADGTFTVDVRALDGSPAAGETALPIDVLADSLSWSADGTELAFLSYVGSRDKAPHLYRLDVRKGKLRDVSLDDLDATPAVRLSPQLEWTADGQLLVLAAVRAGAAPLAVDARRDWWAINRDGRRRNVSAKMVNPPAELWPQKGRAAFFGVADGKVWRIRASGAAVENLTSKLDEKVTSLAWPSMKAAGNAEYPQAGSVYTQTVLATEKAFYRLDLESGAIESLRKPGEKAELVAHSPASGTYVFSSSDRNGTFIWRAGPSTDTLMAANAFLKDIAEGEFKRIDYTSLDGEKLKAWIILPVGYQPGRRYPLITWAYAGSMARDVPSPYDSIAQPSSLNMQIPAANGYAVLLPSMPLKPEGSVDDPMLALPTGVLPAVDEAIRLGIADPERLYLMGQSFGGFSTYGLVTQTRRFAAAVSFAGLSDLISLYGQFDARLRYDDYPHEQLFQPALLESAQGRMGSPPWRDLGRYIRNSPVFFVDRVQTPLMIVQGDVDYVALQQGEEFFASLYRQGKRARFVRYWGEGHVLESPANIRDMWRRVFEWLEMFKGKP